MIGENQTDSIEEGHKISEWCMTKAKLNAICYTENKKKYLILNQRLIANLFAEIYIEKVMRQQIDI